MSDDGVEVDQPLHVENVPAEQAAGFPVPFAADDAAAIALQMQMAPFDEAITLVLRALHEARQRYITTLSSSFEPAENVQITADLGSILARVETYARAVHQRLFDAADLEVVYIVAETSGVIALLEQIQQPLAKTEQQLNNIVELQSAKQRAISYIQHVKTAFEVAEGLPAHQHAIKEFVKDLPPQVNTHSSY
jgi:hypothetical protein